MTQWIEAELFPRVLVQHAIRNSGDVYWEEYKNSSQAFKFQLAAYSNSPLPSSRCSPPLQASITIY
jgi:hypothetical protein